MEALVFIIPFIALLLAVVGAYAIAIDICQKSWKEKVPQSKLLGFTTVFAISFTLIIYFAIGVAGFWIGGLFSLVIAGLIAGIICQLSWKEKVSYFKLMGFSGAFSVSFVLLLFLMGMAMAKAFGR